METSAQTYNDTPAHAATYHKFMLGLKWLTIHLAVIITVLIISFATPAGLGWGVIAGAAVLAAGVYAMSHGLAHSTENDNSGSTPAAQP